MLLALALALAMQAVGTPDAAAPLGAPYDSALEARTREVSAGLRCPVCQGLSIQDSPSELAVQMKDVVRQQLRAGKTQEEIEAYFVSKYGEWVLLEPKASGANLIVYLLPVALIIGGGVFIWFMVRKWSAAGVPVTGTVEEEQDTVAR
jgi:cytochrome c-type biogenesis protein CcmH